MEAVRCDKLDSNAAEAGKLRQFQQEFGQKLEQVNQDAVKGGTPDQVHTSRSLQLNA